MADVNIVVIVGRLTRDAELKYTPTGMPVLSFSVAVNRRVKKNETWIEEACFFDVSYFGKGAEAINQYMTKGKQVAINGELRQDRWEKDGQARSKISIVANNVQLLGGGQGQGNYAPSQPRENSYKPRQEQEAYNSVPSYEDDSFDEDLPF